MCLSVYIGTSHPLVALSEDFVGELGIEPASWKPAPLERMKYLYYAGQRGSLPELGCSCLLLEFLDWRIEPPAVISDDLYPHGGPCPFEMLRTYCEQVLDQGGEVILVSEESGGSEEASLASDYDNTVLFLDDIRRGRVIFGSSLNNIPYRAQLVMRASGALSGPLSEGEAS